MSWQGLKGRLGFKGLLNHKHDHEYNYEHNYNHDHDHDHDYIELKALFSR
jgi:hypothetical protein